MTDYRRKPGSPGDILNQLNTREIRRQTFESPEVALTHFGTKGMRWGIRNEQLSASSNSTVGDPVTIAIGAAYAAFILGSLYVSVRDIRRMKNDSGIKIEKQNTNVAWKKKPELAKKMNVDELQSKVVKQVNPDYPKPGTKMNCRRATFTYEMRRRGYDVTATKSHFAIGQDAKGLKTAVMANQSNTKHESMWGQKQVSDTKTFRNATPTRKSELIFESLNKYPEGSRGELGVGWLFGGGHSMAFEIVKGRAVIFDTQTSETYRNPASFAKFAEVTHDAAHTRTDNIPLDDQFLRRWMVNA